MAIPQADAQPMPSLPEITAGTIPRMAWYQVSIVILLLLSIVGSVWQYAVARTTGQSLMPLTAVITDIGHDIAEFHIWLEEILQGDDFLTRDEVMAIIARAGSRVDAILAGGRIGQTDLPDGVDDELETALTELREQIDALETLANRRFEMGADGMSGTNIDQEFDEKYDLAAQFYDRAIDHLIEHEIQNLARLSLISAVLVGITVVTKIMIVILILFSHRSFRSLISRLSEEINIKEGALVEARKSQKAKTSFLAMMSHELRTPLNAIMGFSEVMKTEMMGAMPPKYKEYADLIYSSAERFLSIINTLIDISRIESGRTAIRPEQISLRAMANDIVAMLQPRADQGAVTVHIDVAAQRSALVTDKKLLGDILVNLLHNAIKFNRPGGEVRLSYRRDGDSAVLTVADTGIGMTREEIDMAMRAFSQVDPHLARPGEGSGLGLPLAKMATESLGGVFTITSRKDIGTQVDVSLPRESKSASLASVGS